MYRDSEQQFKEEALENEYLKKELLKTKQKIKEKEERVRNLKGQNL